MSKRFNIKYCKTFLTRN